MLADLLTIIVQLFTELLHQRSEVLLVLGADNVVQVALGARPLSIKVDSVEDASGCARTSHTTPARVGQVASNEQIDTRLDEGCTRYGCRTAVMRSPMFSLYGNQFGGQGTSCLRCA